MIPDESFRSLEERLGIREDIWVMRVVNRLMRCTGRRPTFVREIVLVEDDRPSN
jgi:hypothetical protein